MDGRFKIKQFSVDRLGAACQRCLFLQKKAGAMVSVREVYRHPDAYLDIRLLGPSDLNEPLKVILARCSKAAIGRTGASRSSKSANAFGAQL